MNEHLPAQSVQKGDRFIGPGMRATTLLVSLAIVGALLGWAAPPAHAAKDALLALAIVGPPPGFVVSKKGINGPINSVNLGKLAPAFAAAFGELEKVDAVEGYAAMWVDRKGGSAFMILFRLTDDSLAETFYGGMRDATRTGGRVRFAVAGIPQSFGYTDSLTTGYAANSVVFRLRNIVAFALIGSVRRGQYKPADAIALAKRQYLQLPSESASPRPSALKSLNTAHKIVQDVLALIPLFLIAAIIVVFVRRQRRRQGAQVGGLDQIVGHCENGHPIHVGGSFCATCGAPLVDQADQSSATSDAVPPP